MALGILIVVAVLGAIVGAIVLLARGVRSGVEWAPRNFVRVYLYIASMAGIIVLVAGLSGVLTVGLAAAFGNDFIYGESYASPIPTCAPGGDPNAKCAPVGQQVYVDQRRRELDRRRGDDLIKGITFTVFGALFWGAHFVARRGVMATDEGTSGLRRGYLMLGTVIFGISTVILLPTGIYQALSYLILPAESGVYRQGVGDSLASGLVTLPLWLIFLWLVVRDFRSAPPVPPTAA